MSNIKKIRQEIERRREANKRQYLSSNGGMNWQRMCGEEDCLVELLSFIDSLPEETCKDSLQVYETCKENTDSFTSLEEAAENYIHEVIDAAGHPGWDWETQDITEAFKAEAKWMEGRK